MDIHVSNKTTDTSNLPLGTSIFGLLFGALNTLRDLVTDLAEGITSQAIKELGDAIQDVDDIVQDIKDDDDDDDDDDNDNSSKETSKTPSTTTSSTGKSSSTSSSSSTQSGIQVTPIVDKAFSINTASNQALAQQISAIEWTCMTIVSGSSLTGQGCIIPDWWGPTAPLASTPLPSTPTSTSTAPPPPPASPSLGSAGNGHGNCTMILYGSGYYGPLNSTLLLQCLSNFEHANWDVGANCADVNWYKSSYQNTYQNATDCWLACVDCIADGIVNGGNNIAYNDTVGSATCIMGYESGPGR